MNVFAHRLIEPEVLDHSPPEIARRNLADLVRINAYFGGHSTLRRLLSKAIAAPDAGFTLLDVGAASGDTGRLITALYPAAAVTNLDLNLVNLGMAAYPKVIANAFELPFRPGAFDYVLSSLFLHHFEDAQVSALLRGMYQIARRAILVVDLERHILPYLFLPASRPLFRWGEITVQDGVKSVRASFRQKELQLLARKAGIDNPVVECHRPAFRLTLRGLKPDGR